MSGLRTRTSWRRRLVLLGALVAFLLPALAAPFGHLCLCLDGGVPVAVGGCCCDDGAGRPCAGDEACVEPPACPGDDGCRGETCACIDLTGSDDPFAAAERRLEALPSPEIVAAAVCSPVAPLRSRPESVRLPLPPPDPAETPPLRPRVLRI